MQRHTLTGVLSLEGRKIPSDFTAMIHRAGYLYARSPGHPGVAPIQVHIQPFTAHQLLGNHGDPFGPLHCELRGNQVGHVRFGADNPDGEWRTWDLTQVVVDAAWFADGLSLQLELTTERGAWTSRGATNPATLGTLAPLACGFTLFVPLATLPVFLRGEQEDWVDPELRIRKFCEALISSRSSSSGA